MERLFVVEANKAGREHSSFNAAMIRALLRDREEGVGEAVFFGEATHGRVIRSLLPGKTAITYERIPVVSGLERTFVRKFIVELVATLRVLARARRQRAKVVFLSVFPNVLPFILLLRPLFGNIPVHVFLHGELESLLIKEKLRVHREGFWVHFALTRAFNGRWPRLYVLGSGIRQRLLEHFPRLGPLREVRAIEHPYAFNEPLRAIQQPAGKLRVGLVGAGRRIKGVAEFFKLAESLSECVAAGRLELTLVGGLDRDCAALRNPWVKVLANEAAGVEMHDYRRAIANLDCALFLPATDYSLTASGSVFDVINEGVEILALKSRYLLDLSRLDVEGGMKFFTSPEAIEAEIRRRLEQGAGRRRFEYPRIRYEHSPAVETIVQAEILSEAPFPVH